MIGLRVFPDTGVLVAMDVFPRYTHGNLTLAGEVPELYEKGAFDLVISQVVIDELEEVINRDFPEYRSGILDVLAPFEERLTCWPTPQEIEEVLPHVADPYDAPILAAAVLAAPDIVLSNDFKAFHSPEAKTFWSHHQIQIESLYGLLCVFGRQERHE